jgi:putative flippase GtrA
MLLFTLTWDLVFKFIRFGLVGVSGTMIDFGLTYVSKEIFKSSKYVANAFGFIIAASSNYYLNRMYTFHSHNTHVAAEYSRFFIVAIIGLGLSTAIIYVVNQKMNYNFYIAKVVATGIVLFWNFLANALFTFA